MDPTQRKTVRGWREQLVTLINGWDPAGLLAAGAPRDEYDCLVDKLLSLLSRQATVEEVAEFLESEISSHFGARPSDTAQFAKRAVSWFHIASAEQ